MKNEKPYISSLKALAVAGVVTLHVAGYVFNDRNSFASTLWWFSNFINSATHFCVPIFVMVSGALMLGRTQPISLFYRKRLSRVGYAFLFWSIFYILFSGYTKNWPDHFVVDSIKRTILLGNTYPHLWFLTMYLFLMAILPFLNKAITGGGLDKLELKILLSLTIIPFSINTLAALIKLASENSITWHTNFLWYAPYLILGYYLDNSTIRFRTIPTAALIIGLACLGTLGNYIITSQFNTLNDNLLNGSDKILGLLFSISVFLAAKQLPSKIHNHWITEQLSKASFGIYLIHPVFLFLLIERTPENWRFSPAFIPTFSLLIVLTSYISTLLLKKMPLGRWIT